MQERAKHFYIWTVLVAIAALVVLVVLFQVQAFNREQDVDLIDNALNQASNLFHRTNNQSPAKLADGRLRVDSPKEGDTVGQTFTVSGFAQGWFDNA